MRAPGVGRSTAPPQVPCSGGRQSSSCPRLLDFGAGAFMSATQLAGLDVGPGEYRADNAEEVDFLGLERAAAGNRTSEEQHSCRSIAALCGYV